MQLWRRLRPARAAGAATLVVAVAACGSGESAVVEVGPAAPRAREDAETLTTDLADSQVTASTVARPETPPPCAPAVITSWTAAVEVGADRSTAIVRLRNDGAEWCEIDVRESPRIDPRTEPDLWLEPGEWGDLWIGADESAVCGEPKAVTIVEIAIRDEVREVPTAAVVPCDWTITAMFGQESPTEACTSSALAVTVEPVAVVVRNTSITPCTFGELIDVDGAGSLPGPEGQPGVTALAAGDTVAFSRLQGNEECGVGPVTLQFDVGGDLAVDGLLRCDFIQLGGGRPFYDGPNGPLADVPATLSAIEVTAALALLDPFAEL